MVCIVQANAVYPVKASQFRSMLMDQRFYEMRASESGIYLDEYECTRNAIDGSVTIRTTLSIKTELFKSTIPRHLHSMLPQTVVLKNTEIWDTDFSKGSISIECIGVPLEYTAKIIAADIDAGLRCEFSGEVRSNVPFLGTSIETAVNKHIVQQIITKDAVVAKKYLDSRGSDEQYQ